MTLLKPYGPLWLSSGPWHPLPSHDHLHHPRSPSLHGPHHPGDSATQMESRAPRWALRMLNDLESSGKGIESVVTSRKCTSIGLHAHYLVKSHLFYSRQQDLKEWNPWSWVECKISWEFYDFLCEQCQWILSVRSRSGSGNLVLFHVAKKGAWAAQSGSPRGNVGEHWRPFLLIKGLTPGSVSNSCHFPRVIWFWSCCWWSCVPGDWWHHKTREEGPVGQPR